MEYFVIRNGIRIIYRDIYIPKIEKKIRKNKKKSYPKEFKEKRKLILKGGFCTKCGSCEYLQVHHIDKNIFNNEDNNLLLLCYSCHSEYHNHMKGKNPPKWLK